MGFSVGENILLHMATQYPDLIKSMAIVSATLYFPYQTREIMQQCAVESKSEQEWKAMREIHMHGDEQIKMLTAHVYY